MRALVLLGAALLSSCASGPGRNGANIVTLRAGLESADAPARARAAFALGQFGMSEIPEGAQEPATSISTREAAAAALIPAVSDPSAAVRRAAVEALGKVGGPDAEDALLSAGTDVDAGVRGETALALFRLRFLKRVQEYSTSSVNKLIALSADVDPEVRWRAVYGFSRFAEPRAKRALVAAQLDADKYVRLFAARSLAKIGQAPNPALFSDADMYVRAEAVAACGAAKKADDLPPAVFTDPSAHVRAAAADAVAATGRADLAARLEAMADGDSPMPRGRALLALAKLRGDAESARLASARRDPDWWSRSKAYEASAHLSGGAVILRAAVKDPDARAASAALEALAGMKAPFVEEALGEVLRDPRAPLELLGTAADAAAARKSMALVAPLLAAARRSTASIPMEVREGLRGAIAATAEAHPDKKDSILKDLKSLPAVGDEPKAFPRLRASPVLVLETVKGKIELFLDAAAAPNHAAAIAAMARKGLYDGTIWHRVVTAFVVQGGDPRGSGWGDAGYRLVDEVGRVPFIRGTLGMPKAGKDTGGCQLFVTLVPTPHLDGRYTAFGGVVSGMDVIDKLEPGDKILKAYLR
jgi:cyclophilin family peptidyl-prolyl cis-trans isomerase/HEAT repeat protein